MAISKSDIKLLASQELTDYDTGGGAMTLTEVQDGNVNNLFSDISRMDRTIGRVSLRKAFLAVQAATTDTYYGAHAIVTDPPDDGHVNVCIFQTPQYDDRRVDAQSRLESYVIRSVLTRWRIYGPQTEGQKTLLLLGKIGVALPEVGDVLCLVEDEGESSEFYQFVRLTSVAVEVQEFTSTVNNSAYTYNLQVCTLSISDALRYTFHGGTPSPFDSSAQAGDAAVLYDTAVADATKYYSVVPLVEPITAGAMSAQVESVYRSLVPAARAESPVVDVYAGAEIERETDIAPNGIRLSFPGGSTSGAPFKYQTGRRVQPKTAKVYHNSNTYQDLNGNGTLTLVVNAGYTVTVTVDYATGVFTLASPTWGGSFAGCTIEFQPEFSISDFSNTEEIAISLANRASTYVKTLHPAPNPGNLIIDFMSLGKWYRLTDNGDGTGGHPSGPTVGAFSVNYTTGAVALTLGALPDVDTSILFLLGGLNHYADVVATETSFAKVRKTITVPEGCITPGSLTLTYSAANATQTVTDNSLGALTGQASGSVDYARGIIEIEFNKVPRYGTSLSLSYSSAQLVSEVFTPSKAGGQIALQLTSLPVRSGSITISYLTDYYREHHQSTTVWYGITGTSRSTKTSRDSSDETRLLKRKYDDGAGKIAGDASSTVNYTTGVVVFAPEDGYGRVIYSAHQDARSWSTDTESDTFPDGAAVTVTYLRSGDSATQHTLTFSSFDLELELAPGTSRPLVPGSVSFRLNLGTTATDNYFDAQGVLYRATGVNTAPAAAGSVDYANGRVTISLWSTSSGTGVESVAGTLTSAKLYQGEWFEYGYAFRTPGAPIQAGSLYIEAIRIDDGTKIYATSNLDGTISTSAIQGSVDYETGTVRVRFGQWVAAAGKEAEPWFEAANLDGNGNVWQPHYVLPSSVKYACVVYSVLPIDADLLGVDPVRLPSDGRVPVFRNGDVCVIHHTTAESCPGGLIAGQQITVSGGPFSLIELYDQNHQQVDYSLYSVALATNTITMANPLDLSAYSQPLIAYKRIEDMLLISDVQITGRLAFTSQVTHDYPAGEALVSGALVFGDLRARVHSQFSQVSWTGVWSDSRIGNNTTAQYNSVDYPIQVMNNGATKERWALVFTSATAFQVIGEYKGVIGTGVSNGSVGGFQQIVNALTGEPYFQIPNSGFGSGWSTGNTIRFNTDAANAPIWFCRTTLPGPEEEPTDQFVFQIRGDAN